ncbi:S41 family peptidase [Sediminitomix flava]|uniref:Carboxyl-terminal processing protease n=1 Tax=Sediminitomix flava TaxID=379075 RepID=A0A315Z8U8_SEDFL|nr:S41 family peptidase [Sediminitomix flava]PWJ40120.1 carboxyl-terminal processing protease [Sediminitomix flava]
METRDDQNKLKNIYLPIIVALCICAGMWLGKFIYRDSRPNSFSQHSEKLDHILQYIDQFYVDSVNADHLSELAINRILEELDPHTSYIAPKNSEIVNSHLDEGFEGIGVEFRLLKDTIKVVNVLKDGPSSQAGIKAGDQLIYADTSLIAGTGKASNELVKKLRGKKGTIVNLKVKRYGVDSLINYAITRGHVPTPAVDAAFMLDSKSGYIRINKFGSSTYQEFKSSLDQLKEEGMTQLVLDLRDNGGGYLSHAVKIVDEFLDEGKLIVKTKGKYKDFDSKDYSTSNGAFKEGKLIVLINQYSASASEIVAGALQDYDRALIVGKRSFGKGLVQRQLELEDGALLRLTISRYYTPSGRSIQKPYEGGNYEQALGEVKSDSLQVYHTESGRTVLGGGGIVPDIEIKEKIDYSALYFELLQKDLFRDFAIKYISNHKADFDEMNLQEFSNTFTISNRIYDNFISYIKDKSLSHSVKIAQNQKALYKNTIKSTIGDVQWNTQGYYKVKSETDNYINEAMNNWPKLQELITNQEL